MGLAVFSLEQAAQWDTIVRSFAKHDVYYLSGYVRAFQLHGDGEPLLFFYADDRIRGINVVMRRDIALDPRFSERLPTGKLFDFTTPYGYGGWLIEGTGDSGALFTAYETWCAGHRVVSEFVRFHPVLENHVYAEAAYEVTALGETVAIDLASPEIVWANLTSKNRNVIRKAQKNGVRIYNGRSPELYESFRVIYNATMDKDHAAQYYYFESPFYESLLNDLSESAQVFCARLPDGQTIASSVMLSINGRMSYHLSGSIRAYQHLAPTNLLLYRAALWGCANGCKTLHLGGGVGSAEDSLFMFKKAFYRGDLRRFHIGKKVFLPQEYDELTALRGTRAESGFFPGYRA